jgi:hypothetical protein
MLLPLLAAAGLGLWAITEDERAPPSRLRPQRFRRRSTLFDRMAFAFKHFDKKPVRFFFCDLLSIVSPTYREHSVWLREQLCRQLGQPLHCDLTEHIDPLEIPAWKLLPSMDMVDRQVEPHVFWLMREVDRIYRSALNVDQTDPDGNVTWIAVVESTVGPGSKAYRFRFKDAPDKRKSDIGEGLDYFADKIYDGGPGPLGPGGPPGHDWDLDGLKTICPTHWLSVWDLVKLHGLDQLKREWSSILDWVEQENISLQDRTWMDAIAEARAWHLAGFTEEGTYRGPVIPGVMAMVWADGARLDRLVTKVQVEQEGRSLNHCVGGYWPQVRDGKVAVYSYRDANGVPYATLSFNIEQHHGYSNIELDQFKGHNDQVVINEAVEHRLTRWVRDMEEDWGFVLSGDMTAIGGHGVFITEQQLKELRKRIEDSVPTPYEVLQTWNNEVHEALEELDLQRGYLVEGQNELEYLTDQPNMAEQLTKRLIDLEASIEHGKDEARELISEGAPLDDMLNDHMNIISEITGLGFDFNQSPSMNVDLDSPFRSDKYDLYTIYGSIPQQLPLLEVYCWVDSGQGHLFEIDDVTGWGESVKDDELLDCLIAADLIQITTTEQEKGKPLEGADAWWVIDQDDFTLPQQEFVKKYGKHTVRKDKYGVRPGLAHRTRPRHLFWPPGAGVG